MRRVDEDKVEVLEPAVRVVGHGERRRRHSGVVGHHDALRAERAEMRPDGRRARTAVEGEAHGTRVRDGAFQNIAGRHHGSLWLAEHSIETLVDDRHEGRVDAVVERPGAQRDAAAALAGSLRDELVDALAHLLVGFLGIAVGLRRVGHEVSCEGRDRASGGEERSKEAPAHAAAVGDEADRPLHPTSLASRAPSRSVNELGPTGISRR